MSDTVRKVETPEKLKMTNYSYKTQVKVCRICGDRGFSNALLDCSECTNNVVHQYCLGMLPGSINNSFIWVCEICDVPAEPQSSMSMKPRDASIKRSKQGCDVHAEDMNRVKRKIQDISSLYPKSFTRKQKQKKQKRKRAFVLKSEAVSTLRSMSKKRRMGRLDDMDKDHDTNITATVKAKVVTRRQSEIRKEVYQQLGNTLKVREKRRRKLENSNDLDNMAIILVEEQPQPLLTLTPLECETSSEQSEKSINLLCCSRDSGSSLMECPQEIKSGVILLVSLSGEIHVEFADDPQSASFVNSILSLTSSYNDIASDSLAKPFELYPVKQITQNCSIEETEVLADPNEVLMSDVPMEDRSLLIKVTKQLQQQKQLAGNGSRGSVDSSNCNVDGKCSSVDPRQESEASAASFTVLPPHSSGNSPEIRSDLLSLLRNMLGNYDHIFHETKIQPESLVLNLCKKIWNYDVDPFGDFFELAKDLGVDEEWVRNHWDCLKEIAHQINLNLSQNHQLGQGEEYTHSWEGMLHLKGEEIARLQGEIVELEKELDSSKEYGNRLQCGLDKIRSHCNRFHGRSLADGLI